MLMGNRNNNPSLLALSYIAFYCGLKNYDETRKCELIKSKHFASECFLFFMNVGCALVLLLALLCSVIGLAFNGMDYLLQEW
jgi:hypothetical protein